MKRNGAPFLWNGCAVLAEYADNGNGIEKNKLLNILKHLNCNNESESQESSGHIGITNVHERIRLLYGSQYGVQIQTKAFEFTEVHLFIPFEGEED